MSKRLIVWLVKTITNTFFRRIDVVGKQNVPNSGPVIFAGNHPNALMDGWLLTAKCGRWPLHFMANAKLWNYRILGRLLDLSGAVPVYPREDHGDDADNSAAFDKLYEVIESGDCMGIFPEGISHAESQLTKLKTGAARIALAVAARGKTTVTIVPCGLNYIHRHRFRSQVMLEFGEPIVIDQHWAAEYRNDNPGTVRKLTEYLAQALLNVTLNAPDWNTLRFVQTARRLYKPKTADLTPGQYVELNRRFVERYVELRDRPELREFRARAEDYQSRLDMLGLKDYQLRQPVSLSDAMRKITGRALKMLVLLPLAIPGAILHLPVGWVAAAVGERFSYELDDVATLKVFATMLLIPFLYLAIGIYVGVNFGGIWALLTILLLSFSLLASLHLIEAEATLLVSAMSILRVTRLSKEVEELREVRSGLVGEVRSLVDSLARPDDERFFSETDFGRSTDSDTP
jgi:glycerol-3-phosphate O-acyltransferase/dihydroxyacetone phosphate acyltransferase